MNHQQARACIESILKRGAFDTPAAALIAAHTLDNSQQSTAPLAEAVLLRIDKTPAFSSENSYNDGNTLPETSADLIAQLSAYITEHTCWTGRELARLKGLALIWENASRAERMQLRRLWYAGFNEHRAPAEASATLQDLSEWQSRQPTVNEPEETSVSKLSALLSAGDAELAYHHLANYLGPNVNVPGLCWTLGVLAQQVLLHRFDREGLTHSTFIGASVCQQLIDQIPVDTALVLLSQIAHQIWWCRNASGMRGLKAGSTDFGLGLEAAVRSGDYTASQRASRQAAADCQAFWPQVSSLTAEVVDSHNQHWPRAILALAVTKYRCADQPVAPDDAATLGATLAAVHWLSEASPSRV